jgi:hypothetical protein
MRQLLALGRRSNTFAAGILTGLTKYEFSVTLKSTWWCINKNGPDMQSGPLRFMVGDAGIEPATSTV